jgi:hypothetical protein
MCHIFKTRDADCTLNTDRSYNCFHQLVVRQTLNACVFGHNRILFSLTSRHFRECREALLRRFRRVLLDKGNILFIQIILALNILGGLFVKLPARG